MKNKENQNKLAMIVSQYIFQFSAVSILKTLQIKSYIFVLINLQQTFFGPINLYNLIPASPLDCEK